MTTPRANEVPWEKMGIALEDLMRHEGQVCSHGSASLQLLSAVAGDPETSVWRRFLLENENLSKVVGQVLALSCRDCPDPKAVLETVRETVEGAATRRPRDAFELLGEYLRYRAGLPADVRETLDRMVKAGKRAVPLRVIAFASEVRRLCQEGALGKVPEDIVLHWYREISSGRLTSSQARAIPNQILSAQKRLLAHLRRSERNDQLDESTVHARYSRVFKSQSIGGMVDIVIAAHELRLVIEVEEIEAFLESHTKDEVMRRFRRLRDWRARDNSYNHETVVLTPVVARFLSLRSDFEPLLEELDRLRIETHNGRFNLENELQRDMEFPRFSMEYSKVFGTNRTGPYTDKPVAELYRIFTELKELPERDEEEMSLSDQDLAEVKRTAYEAVGFLRFLQEFRSSTDRDIVVVGNERYGRQWVVEPIEEYLTDRFTIRYDHVPSHMSMRLRVPSARNYEGSYDGIGAYTSDVFPREFVREMSRHMPHIVVVDGKSASENHGMMRLSRAQKNYANWFAAFNDVRAEGDGSQYQHESCLPLDHFPELLRWYELVRLRRQLQEWAAPGPTYKVTLWTPDPTEMARLGEITVRCELPDLRSERPLAVLANPMVYRIEGEDIHESLRGTTPYYFDGPDKRVKEKIAFGFGRYGFQPQIEGPMTATYVAILQRHIKAEVRKLLEGP